TIKAITLLPFLLDAIHDGIEVEGRRGSDRPVRPLGGDISRGLRQLRPPDDERGSRGPSALTGLAQAHHKLHGSVGAASIMIFQGQPSSSLEELSADLPHFHAVR